MLTGHGGKTKKAKDMGRLYLGLHPSVFREREGREGAKVGCATAVAGEGLTSIGLVAVLKRKG